MIELKLNLRPLIKKLEIAARYNTTGEITGEYRALFKGKGLDFEGYRTYNPTDDASFIDWKASLRSNDLLVKIMQEERFLKVYLLFDVGNSMLFSSIDKLKCEYAAELIASLAFVILHAGDSVGLVMFTDTIVRNIPVNVGQKQYYMILNALSNPLLYGGKVHFSNILRSLMNQIKREMSVIIISDFIGLDPEFEGLLKLFASKCEISGIMIRDPVDNIFPAERKQVLVQDPFSDRAFVVDPMVVKAEYDKRAQEQLSYLRGLFMKINSGFLNLNTSQEFVTPVTKFFQERRRRWR